MRRHIVLVGLPGSGKTTVGRLVAEALAAPFVDVDVEIAGQAGSSIEQIFEQHGEVAFRRAETDAVSQELAGEPAVIAPGGGWAAQPGRLESAMGRAFTVYLRVSAAEAAQRCVADGAVRPLLQGRELRGALERLLEVRESFYARCQGVVEGDGLTPAEVAAQVVQLARSQGGW